MTIKIGIDKVSLQDGKIVFARGEHRQPVKVDLLAEASRFCGGCKYDAVQYYAFPCKDCFHMDSASEITYWEAADD